MTHLERELANLVRNDRQWEAYLWNGHCVVLAGPGSGKTATLTLKVMRLLTEQISPPRGLACLTFNNEAVREFRHRLKKLGLASRPNVFLGTVHSFCLSSVIIPFGRLFYPDLPSPLRVAPDDIRRSSLEKAMDIVGISEQPSQFQTRFDKYRRTYLDRDSPQWHRDEECARAIEHYETLIHEKGYVDFDDLVLIALRLIEDEPFVRRCLCARYPWFVIDEYQDLGYPLHRIVLNLVDRVGVKIFVVGDPDQSIYGFTGADPKYLQQLASREDMKSIRLELNYRSGQKIIDGSEVILSPSIPRNYKSSRGDSDPGEINFIQLSDGLEEQSVTIVEQILPQLEKAGYQPRETAILYIDRNDARVITGALDGKRIKYTGEKDQRYKRTPMTRWLEDVAQWCCGIRGQDGVRFNDISGFWIRLLRDTGTTVTDKQLLLHLRRFFSVLCDLQKPQMALSQWLSDLDNKLSLGERLSLLTDSPEGKEAYTSIFLACGHDKPLKDFTVADLAGCGPNTNTISLTTLHSSKGLQFDVVVIPGLEEGRLPSWAATSDQALGEARRTFYVGFTRARYLVYILYSGWYQNRYGRLFEDGPSRFVLELQEALGFQE